MKLQLARILEAISFLWRYCGAELACILAAFLFSFAAGWLYSLEDGTSPAFWVCAGLAAALVLLFFVLTDRGE